MRLRASFSKPADFVVVGQRKNIDPSLRCPSDDFRGSQQAVGIRDGGSGVDRTARPVERIVHEIKSALPGELCFVTERDLNLVGKTSFEPRTVAGKGQEIGLAHIKV